MEIETQEIEGKRCLILLGKNEAGKSNILKAILAVFGEYKVSPKDQRKENLNENIESGDCCVRTIFKLDKEDFAEIHKNFLEKYTNAELIEFDNGLELKDLIKKAFHEILLQIDIEENKTPSIYYWIFKKPFNFKKRIGLVSGKEEFIEVLEGETQFSIR